MPNYSGWLFTDAVNLTPCSKCGAKPESNCRTPKGRKAWPPHNERVAALDAEAVRCATLGTPERAALMKARTTKA
jgi:hypothetical protein